ncbi:hypothetical protein BH23BAC3_BH23BAC3_32970 [soil metagenome]
MKVSVIIPCYNGEEYIGQTLGSLFDQTCPADEIIVVDDGSTDRSAEIAQSFGESVTVLSKGGGGAAKARNCGSDHAKGDALMFLDADDVLGPDVLENLLDQLKKNPDGVVACPWYRLEKMGEKWVKRPPSCKTLGKTQDYLSGWLTGWYHLPCSILWSRSAYENRGGWDPRAYVNDDGDLMMRALTDGVNLQITDKGASFYRRMPDEQLTESLSGAQFTHKGREAQIYVIHKIAQILEDRDRLNTYRKPVTKAFKNYRNLCKDHYPDLSEYCSELINRYGELRYMQIARNFGRSGLKAVHSARRLLGLLKKRVLLKIRSSQNHSAKKRDKENYEEIRYGLDTYQKIKKAGKKGGIKKPSNPEVSVILPFSDEAHTFNRSLLSVLNQEFENFEVIVTGSRSSATLKSEVEKYDDSRIRLFIDETNNDIIALRNRGLKMVKGDFAAFLDQGDEWHSAKLARQSRYFQKVPDEVGLVYTGSEFVNHQGKMTEFLPVAKGDVYKKLLHQNIIDCCSSVMIRRTVISSIGIFDPNLPGFENHDYWLRISRFFKFDFLEHTLVKCINRDVEGTSKKSASEMKNRQRFLEKYYREIKSPNLVE